MPGTFAQLNRASSRATAASKMRAIGGARWRSNPIGITSQQHLTFIC